eukprot:9484686-Pyramimonas_sp.AAC.1
MGTRLPSAHMAAFPNIPQSASALTGMMRLLGPSWGLTSRARVRLIIFSRFSVSLGEDGST